MKTATPTAPNWWPIEFQELYEPLVIDWKISGDFELKKQLTDGQSGAYVCIATAAIDSRTQTVVLRLLKVDGDDPLHEITILDALSRSAPEWYKRRVPPLLKHFLLADKLAFIQEIAGGGVEFIYTLRSLPSGIKPYAYKAISHRILSEFNTDSDFNDRALDAASIANLWLQPKQLSSAISRAGQLLRARNVDLTKPAFEFADLILPNPFAFFGAQRRHPELDVRPLMGRTHGDLHANNILISRVFEEGNPVHWFIDFSKFAARSPLLFDNAYLEIAEIVERCAEFPDHQLRNVLERCSTLTHDDSGIDPNRDSDIWSAVYHVKYVSSGVDDWVQEFARSQRSDLRRQQLLARVCAALNFANKRLTSPLKNEFSLLLSSAFLNSLMSFAKVSWTKESTKIGLRVDTPSGFYKSDGTAGNLELLEFIDPDDTYTILSLGPGTDFTDAEAELLSKTSIQAVFDFSEGDLEAVAERFRIDRQRKALGAHKLAAEGDLPDFDPDSSLVWFEIEPDSPTFPAHYSRWRKRTLSRLRQFMEIVAAGEYRRVLFVAVGFEVADRALEAVITTIIDCLSVGRLEVCIIVDRQRGFTVPIEISLISQSVQCLVIDGDAHQYATAQALAGRVEPSQTISIPRRDGSGAHTSLVLEPGQQAGFREAFEVVHGGLSADATAEREFDFLQGAEITWRELEDHLDVDRDHVNAVVTPVLGILNRNRSGSVALVHAPGAGGTTLARRIAWALKEQFPTVLLKARLPFTSTRIQELYALAGNIPILIVAEGSVIDPGDRNLLFRELKELNLNFCMLDVRRGGKNAGKDVYLDRIVTDREAGRFYRRYSAAAPHAKALLKQLTNEPAARQYRIPFMYGLFAFSRQFKSIDSYVKAGTQNASPVQRLALLVCSLGRAYAQVDIPLTTLAGIVGLASEEIEKGSVLFGEAFGRLAIFTTSPRHARVVHPVIAEAILRALLVQRLDVNSVIFRNELGSFCLALLDTIEQNELGADVALKELVTRLFISRSPWEYETGRKQFSDLILELDNKELSREILLRLTEVYPNEDHFWHHVGRFSSYRALEGYEAIGGYYRKAIELNPRDSLHHHGLGFITRDEINRLLTLVKRRSVEFDSAITEIAGLYTIAKGEFEAAAELDRDSVYPLVTMTQLCIEICEFFKERRGATSIAAIFNEADPSEEWCQRVLTDGLQSHAAYRYLCETVGREAAYDDRLAPRFARLYGRIEDSLAMMRKSLQTGNGDEFGLRRAIAAVLDEIGGSPESEQATARNREICDCLEENYRLYPERFRDIRLWIRSYAKLPEFSFNVASERMESWQRLYDHVDAYYYSYILRFLQVDNDRSKHVPFVAEFIDETRTRSRKIEREHSFEWLGIPEQHERLVPTRRLGKWDNELGFFTKTDVLRRVVGRIDRIITPAQGYISINGVSAFFQPGNKFRKGRDELAWVTMYLGFSYDGPRAWSVEFDEKSSVQ